MKNLIRNKIFDVMVIVFCMLFATSALAAKYYYVDWKSANIAGGTASGLITLPDGSTVTINFQAINSNGSAGNLKFAQTNGTGTNYWVPSAPYISQQVDNAPPDSDILSLIGGQNQTYKITLSEAIKDPIMAIVSLGQSGSNTKYVFDAPFTIVSQGSGYFGGSTTALTQLPGNILNGNEGHGTIQFIGTFSTFSWTVPTPEDWHGFTFGIRTTERIEPTTSIPQSCIATYQLDGSLHIPYVSVPDAFGGKTIYEADMKLIPFSNPTAFQLTGAKPNPIK